MATVTLELPDTVEKKLQKLATDLGRDVASIAVEMIEKELANSSLTNGNQVLIGEESRSADLRDRRRERHDSRGRVRRRGRPGVRPRQ